MKSAAQVVKPMILAQHNPEIQSGGRNPIPSEATDGTEAPSPNEESINKNPVNCQEEQHDAW